MGLKYVYIAFILMLLSVSTYGQELLERKLSLDIKELPFDDVIEEIKKQTGVSFSYFADIFQANQRFTIYKQDKSLKEVLDFLVLGTDITYGVFKRQIIFYRPAPKPPAIYAVSGIVLDSLSRRGIANAHIYLDKTDIGAYTDENGNFILKNVQEGSYGMVVSHVSYGVFNYRLNLFKNADSLQIEVSPKVNVLQEMEVVSLSQNINEDFIKIFENEVLGSSPEARLCTITNPEDLFVYKDSTHQKEEFEILARRPISIVNYWLGYYIKLDLIFFEIKNGQIVYIARTNFQPMNSDSRKMRRRWNRNRMATYNGSLRHFSASLAGESRGKSRFRQKIVKQVPNEVKFKYLPADIRSKDVIKLVSITSNLEDGSFLQVYHRATESLSYLSKTDFEYKEDYQSELIKDYYDPKKGVVIYGTWATKRLAETLPLNYSPYEKKPENDLRVKNE